MFSAGPLGTLCPGVPWRLQSVGSLERGVLRGTHGGRGGVSCLGVSGLPTECQPLRLCQSLLGHVDVGVAAGRDLRVYVCGAARNESSIDRDGGLDRRGQRRQCIVGRKIVGERRA